MSAASYCHIHHAYEPIPPATYIVCGECGHVYESAADLVDDHNRDTGKRLRVPDVNKILACPGCGHDF